jgi:ribosomal protein S18 acetylase RimI-like enzyme
LPGLNFRGFRGKEDFPHMADIINAVNETDDNDGFVTPEEIEKNYSFLQRSDTAQDLVFIEIDGIPVGYGRCMWDEEMDGDYLYSFFIHMKEEGRNNGIGYSVARYFINRLTKISNDHPVDAPKYFQSWCSDTQTWYNRLMTKLGFEPVRYGISMIRPGSQPVKVFPLPENIEVREVQPEDYRKIWEADVEAFRDHWGFVEQTEKDYQAYLEFPYFEPELWKVAWDGDQVVGMVRNFINPKENEKFNRQRGYTEFISVRRPWRRQGVARALLTQSIQMFLDMGMDETSLGVDTQNPNSAMQLYHSVGYTETKRYITYRKPF